MDSTESEIAGIITQYRNKLEQMGVRVERVVLFGSHARGNASNGSDIDLLIVSPDFEKMNRRERLELLGIAAARIWQPIEAIGCTREEVDNVEPATFLEEVLETGVAVG